VIDADEAVFDAAVLDLVRSPLDGLRRCISLIERTREAGDTAHAHAQTQVVVQVLNGGGLHLEFAEALARELVEHEASRTNLELLAEALNRRGKIEEGEQLTKRALQTPLSAEEEVDRALVAKMNQGQ
jgi:hypothetical protein